LNFYLKITSNTSKKRSLHFQQAAFLQI